MAKVTEIRETELVRLCDVPVGTLVKVPDLWCVCIVIHESDDGYPRAVELEKGWVISYPKDQLVQVLNHEITLKNEI